jgi:transposase-like protein
MINLRLQRGQEIAEKVRQIKRLSDKKYRVNSQSGNGYYHVVRNKLGWVCSCADHIYRGVVCKHIHAVEISLAIRNKVIEIQPPVTIPEANVFVCTQCQSDQIVKHGIRHNKYGDLQRYSCRNCYKRFTVNLGFEKMRATPQMITSAMQLYFTGESFRNVQKFLKLQGVHVSHMAVYNWINKYVTLMEKYLEKITPNVSSTWRTDELYLKIKGDTKYLYAIMDDETRFLIAQQVASSKNVTDITPMFRKAKEITGRRPTTLISDGAPNFHEAYIKEFRTIRNPRTKHIMHIRLQGDHNNNKMERFNGEVRDREKVMRGLKRTETKILKGYQLYHNYLRPHEGIGNKTPAEVCGIEIEGQNKWITMIQNASKSNEVV